MGEELEENENNIYNRCKIAIPYFKIFKISFLVKIIDKK